MIAAQGAQFRDLQQQQQRRIDAQAAEIRDLKQQQLRTQAKQLRGMQQQMAEMHAALLKLQTKDELVANR
jgi:uncharacterized protein HemX